MSVVSVRRVIGVPPECSRHRALWSEHEGVRTTPEDLEADPTGRRYEELVEQIFAEVGELQGLETVDLSRRKSVQGRTVKHEVDVWWTFRVGETTTYAFQAKDQVAPITQGDMLLFKVVLEDLVDYQPRGVFVTRSTYQKGARTVATANGIHALELRKPKDSDWDGRVRDVHIQITAAVPHFRNYQLQVPEHDAAAPADIQGWTDTLEAFNERGEAIATMHDLQGRLLWPDFEAHDWAKRTLEFTEPTWIGLPGGARQRVLALAADVMVSTHVETIVINGSDLAVLIVKDALTDRSVWYRRSLPPPRGRTAQ